MGNQVEVGKVQGVWKKHFNQTLILAREVNATSFIEKLTSFVNLSPETMINDSLVIEITTEYFKIVNEAKAKVNIELCLMQGEYNKAAIVAAGSFSDNEKATSAKYLTLVLEQLLSMDTLTAADDARVILIACCKEYPHRVTYILKAFAICKRENIVEKNKSKVFVIVTVLLKHLTQEELAEFTQKCDPEMAAFLNELVNEYIEVKG